MPVTGNTGWAWWNERCSSTHIIRVGIIMSPLTEAYRRRDYRAALAIVLKVNIPACYWPHVLLSAAYGQLGE